MKKEIENVIEKTTIQSEKLPLKGIFQPASPTLIDLLKEKQFSSEPTFVFPTKYISSQAAKVGYLLSHHVNLRRRKKTIHRSFYAGSHLDAVSGVVKLMRHNHWLKSKGCQGRILIYDKRPELKSFFHPLSRSEESVLVRGVFFTKSTAMTEEFLKNEDWIGFICCYDGTETKEEIDTLFALCKQKNIIKALDESQVKNWYEENRNFSLTNPPDITVFGENLTNWQVPFGAFTTVAEVYEPWNSITTCLTHSSSYTGNTISLSMVLKLFSEYHLGNVTVLPLTLSRKQKYEMYATFVNPQIAWIFYTSGLSPEIKLAKGSGLLIESEGKEMEILDGAAGSGCSLRGHNPEGILEEVLNKHNSSRNYWGELSDKLKILSNMSYVFPAASGSSATDIAVILALLANPKRTRIITFKNNYSGKSLISLNLSRFKYFQEPFHPFYFDLIEIDPFAPNAKEILYQELTSKNLALIWFEILQGQNLDMIPHEIIDLINTHKKAGGYLVGVDEILTGFFRTGDFLCSQNLVLEPDLIAIAKGIFP